VIKTGTRLLRQHERDHWIAGWARRKKGRRALRFGGFAELTVFSPTGCPEIEFCSPGYGQISAFYYGGPWNHLSRPYLPIKAGRCTPLPPRNAARPPLLSGDRPALFKLLESYFDACFMRRKYPEVSGRLSQKRW